VFYAIFTGMNIFPIRTCRWIVSRPYDFDNLIDVVNKSTGQVICTLDVSDYKSLAEAKRTAKKIASLPALTKITNT
jgi:hypothetical protein